MKKRLLFIVILCISVSYCIFQKANANQYLSVITTLTLEEAESLADNELSTGDCESRLMDTWTEHLSSGAYAIVHEYKFFSLEQANVLKANYMTITQAVL